MTFLNVQNCISERERLTSGIRKRDQSQTKLPFALVKSGEISEHFWNIDLSDISRNFEIKLGKVGGKFQENCIFMEFKISRNFSTKDRCTANFWFLQALVPMSGALKSKIPEKMGD